MSKIQIPSCGERSASPAACLAIVAGATAQTVAVKALARTAAGAPQLNTAAAVLPMRAA